MSSLRMRLMQQEKPLALHCVLGNSLEGGGLLKVLIAGVNYARANPDLPAQIVLAALQLTKMEVKKYTQTILDALKSGKEILKADVEVVKKEDSDITFLITISCINAEIDKD